MGINTVVRELLLQLPDGDKPVYLRIAESVRTAIEAERLKPGELLPSSRNLAKHFSVHRHTVMNATEELIAEGWLESEPGRGYRVVKALPRYFSSSVTSQEKHLRDRKFSYAFPSGLPDLRLFPTEEYYRCLRQALREVPPESLLGYDRPEGTAALREQLLLYLRRLRDITGQRVVVTHGSQEGIFLLAKMLLKPGDLVAVEEMGYSPAWDALRLAGAKLVGVPVDKKGLNPAYLDRVAKGRKISLLYLTPLHQYPTTVTMPVDRRQELYEIATRHRIPILEDDYDHEFHYRSQPLAPLKSRDPESLVYYTSTFSKVVYPSARLGFVALDPDKAPRLIELKRITSRQNNTLLQEAMARWMRSGGFERHLRKMRRIYHHRMLRMADLLRADESVSFELPDGGMSLWVDFKVDSHRLSELAAQADVQVKPGTAYQLEPAPSSCLRLGFASSDDREIEEGLEILLRCARRLRNDSATPEKTSG